MMFLYTMFLVEVFSLNVFFFYKKKHLLSAILEAL